VIKNEELKGLISEGEKILRLDNMNLLSKLNSFEDSVRSRDNYRREEDMQEICIALALFRRRAIKLLKD